MKNDTTHPAFIIGLVSYFLLIMGVVLKGNVIHWSYDVILAAFVFGAVHWVWAIIDVFTNEDLKGTPSRPLWILVVIILAPLGGMLYYAMKRKRISF
ncbi:PLDc N-terminal domain-containing protein [Flavisolibacter ginsenosidimutans]|uniref:Cardiolipin synthase N-terminal domain-containing protein n=1 Tax=Flavisolibacter ginsenosidimutans TaxID=661481 RepID=A0A5B8UCR8_9BACT|nr:PLDc N-terminal domain-containing protein [Flavisolibacter ginsenosidimutans]QEC54467.1 hypothetical protein FSB75_00660 [Flavisolibacter ginsenosidimutans]